MKLKIDRSSPVPLHRQAEMLLSHLITKKSTKRECANEVEIV